MLCTYVGDINLFYPTSAYKLRRIDQDLAGFSIEKVKIVSFIEKILAARFHDPW